MSDSCMIWPHSRLHAKSIYYEAEPRAHAARSCRKPVRAFRFYGKVGRVSACLNPYASENRVSKPLTALHLRGKAQGGSEPTINIGSPSGSPSSSAYWILLVATYVRGFAAASIHTRGSKFDRTNDELSGYAGISRFLSSPSRICVIKSAYGAPEIL